jgi:hypothetical protein
MTEGRRRLRWWALLVTSVALAAGCGTSKAATGPAKSTTTTVVGPSSASTLPPTSLADASTYYLDLAQLDPSLSSYVTQQNDLALRTLLTDGRAFCAILHSGGDIDNAMLSVAAGARSVEATTHLPLSVTTFNAIDSAALVVLCPGDQKLLPPVDQGRIRQLATALAGR